MLKNELAATAKFSLTGLATSDPFPFKPLRSRSIVMLPFSAIIFSSVPLMLWLAADFSVWLEPIAIGPKSKN
ncbi:MAG: hypothetical protein DME94_08905, partial [Verrucomicrobia bacterium]